MKKLVLLSLIAVFACSEASARTRVTVYKRPAAPVVSAVPLAAVPPILIVFDIARRTTCDPKLAVSTGPGDPGFDPKGPKTGNFIIPAIYSRCKTKPQPY